jgi:hypothetical protein
MVKRKTGDRVSGCNDTAAVSNQRARELSRMTDMLDLVLDHFGNELYFAVFRSFPDSLKVDWNYANWTYVEA